MAKYEAWLNRMVAAIDPLLEAIPPDFYNLCKGSLRQKLKAALETRPIFDSCKITTQTIFYFRFIFTHSKIAGAKRSGVLRAADGANKQGAWTVV